MKRIQLYLLLIIFVFSQLHSMEALKKIPKALSKKYKESKKRFWLQAENGVVYIDYVQAKKHPLLHYYIARFGYANSMTSPLKVGCKAELDALSSEKIEDFLKKIWPNDNKKTEKKVDINELLKWTLCIQDNVPKDIDMRITRYLQRLEGCKQLSFVASCMMQHNMRSESHYIKKNFFNNKKFYWEKIGTWPIFYDHTGREVFKIITGDLRVNNGERFIPAYNSNAILIPLYSLERVRVLDLATKKQVDISGRFINFEISPDAHYVAVRSYPRVNNIQIYDVSMSEAWQVGEIDHIDLRDFIFSPAGSKLISWSDRHQANGQIIVWDLSNIQKMDENKKIVPGKTGCTQIIFNSDNEHICMIDNDQTMYEGSTNTFCRAQVTLININSFAATELSSWAKVRVFPEGSDLIIGEGFWEGKRRTRIFTKTGYEFDVPEDIRHFSYHINRNYIFASHTYASYLFDHKMNLITKVHNETAKLKLKPGFEDEIMSKERMYGQRSCWPLPDKQDFQKLQSINTDLTTAQFVFLEVVCSHKRQRQELLKLEKDSSLVKILKTFEDHRPFLQEKLFIAEK